MRPSKLRAPLQVIVIPFRRNSGGTFEYAVFHRSDGSMWQFLSGGAEDQETALEAAKREAHEEAGIPPECDLIALDSRASIPRTAFSPTSHWPPALLVVPEFSFAVDVSGLQFTLSREHDEIRWLNAEDAATILKWDSNRVALWELNERLRKSNSAGH